MPGRLVLPALRACTRPRRSGGIPTARWWAFRLFAKKSGDSWDVDTGNREGITYADGSQSIYEFDEAYWSSLNSRP